MAVLLPTRRRMQASTASQERHRFVMRRAASAIALLLVLVVSVTLLGAACFVGLELRTRNAGGERSTTQRQAAPAPAVPAFITIEKRMTDLNERVKAVEKPEDELYWRVLAYCTACRTPWCKLPWRRHTCLKGDAKAEGTSGNSCDMSWEDYTDRLVRAVPLISKKKAQTLTRECWRQGDSDPGGIGVVTVAVVPKPAADEYCTSLARNGIQCSVVPDSFFEGGPASKGGGM